MTAHLKSPATELAVVAACITTDPELPKGEKWWDTVRVLAGGNSPRSLFTDFDMVKTVELIEQIIKRGNNISFHAVSDALTAYDDADNPVAERIIAKINSAPVITDHNGLVESVNTLLQFRETREIRDFAVDIGEQIDKGEIDSVEAANALRERGSMGGFTQSETTTANEVFADILTLLDSDTLWRVTTGIEDVDKCLRWEPEQYNVVSGSSHAASKNFLVNSAVNALDDGAVVVFCTQDMSKTQLYTSILSCVSSVSRERLYDYLRGGKNGFEEEAVTQIASAQSWISEKSDNLHLLFEHDLHMGVSSLPPKIAGIRSKVGPSRPIIVFYDTLQLDYTNAANDRKDNQFTRTAVSSRAAKNISRGFATSFVMLSHGRVREVGGEDKFVGMDGATSIESDADNVILLTPSSEEAACDVIVEVRSAHGDPHLAKVWMDSKNSTFTESVVIGDEDEELVPTQGDRSTTSRDDSATEDFDSIPTEGERSGRGGGSGRMSRTEEFD